MRVPMRARPYDAPAEASNNSYKSIIYTIFWSRLGLDIRFPQLGGIRIALLLRSMTPAESTMGTKPKPKPTKKAKRRRKPPEEFVDYIVEINDWYFRYWLALSTERNRSIPTTSTATWRSRADCCGRLG